MRRRFLTLFMVALCLGWAGLQPAGAQTERTGQTEGGAFYTIVVPDGWQPADGLVIYNHGFSLSPIGPDPDLGPLAEVQLAQGYAVAASSYSLTGWAVFETHLDNYQMYQAFEAEFGQPESVIINGASLGGIVTARDIEENLIPNVIGALPICGAMGGSRIWDGAVDLRLIYDALCNDVPGGAIPGGANGLPFPPDPNFDDNALGGALQACLGIFGGATEDQQARLAKLLQVTGLPAEFVVTDMGFATFGLADLVYDPRKLAGGQVFDTANVDFGDAEVNGSIARISPDPATRQYFLDNFTPKGQVGDTKIVSIHTDGDGLVIVENQSSYASVVPASNLSVGIISEDTPTHCGFSEAEVVASWESLREWLDGDPQPTPASMQATCDALVTFGLAEGPCRINPEAVVDDITVRVRPRNVCVPGANKLCLGEAGRFHFEVDYLDFQDRTGQGQTGFVTTQDSGSFWFFGPDNVELVVKTVDGRQNNGNFWVFFGSLSNVGFDMTVTDGITGLSKIYSNERGDFASVGDTEAF